MEGPPLSCFHLPDPSFDHVSERYTMNLITAIINSNSLSRCHLQPFNLRCYHNSASNTIEPFDRKFGPLGCLCWSCSSAGLHHVPTHGKSASFRSLLCQNFVCKCFLHLLWSGPYDASYWQLRAVRSSSSSGKVQCCVFPHTNNEVYGFYLSFQYYFHKSAVGRCKQDFKRDAFGGLVHLLPLQWQICESFFNLRQNRNRMQPANSNLPERSQRQRQRETRLTKSVSSSLGST